MRCPQQRRLLSFAKELIPDLGSDWEEEVGENGGDGNINRTSKKNMRSEGDKQIAAKDKKGWVLDQRE